MLIYSYLKIVFRGVGNYSSFSATLFCRILLHQSIEKPNVKLKNEAKCI